MDEKTSPAIIAGLAWYKREDYSRIIQIMSDRHLLPNDFDIWLRKAEKGANELRAQGYTVVKVYVQPDEFLVWCKSVGLDVNATARIKYAAFIAGKGGGHIH